MPESKFERYPHISLLTSLRPTPRILLGKPLLWTIKEDGENASLWIKKGNRRWFGKKQTFMISSRNQEQAHKDIRRVIENTQEFPIIKQLIEDNPNYRIVVEECRKGRSVTGIKEYDRDKLIVIDIYDMTAQKYLPYILVYQMCYHLHIPIVKLYAETRHRSMKDLLKYKNHILEVCKSIGEEGMVIKTYGEKGELIQAKVKLDTPEPIEKKIREGKPIYPTMPDNEVWGAISKVETDFGLTGDPKTDMPHIVEYINEEMKKHLFSKPERNYFFYYKDYMERMKHE